MIELTEGKFRRGGVKTETDHPRPGIKPKP